MPFPGSWFVVARGSATVTRHLASEVGLLGLPSTTSSSRAIPSLRAFRSSVFAAGYVRASPQWYYPRWANRDGGDGGDQKPQKSSPGHDPKDPSAWLDGSEEGKPPSSASSPPSSVPPSDNENPDGFDSSSPPEEPPQTPPPQSPQHTTLTKPTIPENYPQVLALPIARRPLFPGFYKAVVIRNPAVVAAVKEMMKRGQPYIGAFLLKDDASDSDVITDLNAVHEVGVFAQITSIFAANAPGTVAAKDGNEDGLTAVLYPHRRIRITELVKPADGVATASAEQTEESKAEEELLPTPPSSPPPAESRFSAVQTSFLHNFDISVVNVENLSTLPYNKDDQYIRAFMSEIISVFKDIAQLNPLFRDQITNFSINQVASNVFDEPDKLADFAAAVSTGDVQELQDVLESLTVDDRLRKALLVLKRELINAQLQSKLSRDVDSKIAKRQREYYLMEQLKGIKKELGMESDGKDKLIEKFKERATQLKMPDDVQRVFDEELNKLSHLEPAASEANVTRNYLEWITQVRVVACEAKSPLFNSLSRSRGVNIPRKTTRSPTLRRSWTRTTMD